MNRDIKIRCKECSGAGNVIYTINLGEVITDVNEVGIRNKIDAIKFMRNKHPLGLKEAKELVEAAISFLQNVERVFPNQSHE